MRLTVHVSGAKKIREEVKTKEGSKTITKTMNTLTFEDVSKKDVTGILIKIKEDELGTPTKSYLSNEKIPGRSKGNKTTS